MSKFCPSCGEELVDGAKFCKSCGYDLNNNQENRFVKNPESIQRPVSEKTYKISIIIGYVGAILIPLIGFIIGIYLMTRKDSDNARRHATYIMVLSVGIWIISFLFFR